MMTATLILEHGDGYAGTGIMDQNRKIMDMSSRPCTHRLDQILVPARVDNVPQDTASTSALAL